MSNLPKVLQGKPINEALKPIAWLLGTWEATKGCGSLPHAPPFAYCEEIQFSSAGQPLLNYSAFSWHPEKKVAMHSESGYLRIKPGTQELAFMIAHNLGLTTLEEGEVKDNLISLTSRQIARMSWAKDPEVTKIVRSWSLKDHNVLEQVVQMETSNTPLCEHLRVVYNRKA